jgi:tetratricopeptide (TPR) repeat protein
MTRSLFVALCAALLLVGCSGKKAAREAPKPDVEPTKPDDAEARRKEAEEQAKKAQKDYEEALAAAQKAMQAKRYEEAVGHYQQALALSQTEAAQSGLQEAEKLRDQARAEQRRKDHLLAMDAGREALKKGELRGASNSFREALRLIPGDPDATAQLGTAQLALARQLHQLGKGHFDRGRYEEAVPVLAEACQLDPKNVEAAALLKDAEARRDAIRAARKKKEDFSNLLIAGQAAMTAKKYADAVKHYEAALKLFPDDADVRKRLENASKAERRQRLEDYRLAMEAARGAVKKEDEQRAINAFKEALRHLPDDKEALAGLQAATKKHDFKRLLAEARAATAQHKHAEAVKLYTAALVLFRTDPVARQGRDDSVRAEKKQRDDYKLAMEAARDALNRKNYPGAINAFNEALRILPGDRDARDGLKAAEAARDAEVAAARKKQEFDRLMTQGKAAMPARPAEAVQHFSAALRLYPTDAEARSALATATKAAAEAEAATKKQEFDRLMGQARAAAAQNRHADAVKFYTSALNYFPADATARKGRDDAARAEKKQRDDYKLAMEAARDALNRKNYPGAINAFNEALRILPGDSAAQTGLQAARGAEQRAKQKFDQLMSQGRAAMAGKRFADAVRHFEAALRLKPNDAEASAGLRRARDKKP